MKQQQNNETIQDVESEDELINRNKTEELDQHERARSGNPIELYRHIYTNFDPSFVNLLGVQYFNQGSKILVALAAQKLFKDTYGLEPSYL